MAKVWMWLQANIIVLIIALCCLAVVIGVIIKCVHDRKYRITHEDLPTEFPTQDHQFAMIPIQDRNKLEGMKDIKTQVDTNDIYETINRL